MIQQIQDTMTLNDGIQMPGFGLGCYKAGNDVVYDAVRTAVEAGYRMFDTAAFYGNEAEVGRAVRECGLPREELFVVTKLWPTRFADAERGVEESLRALDTYADLFLLHWPGTDEVTRNHAWETLLRYREKGLIRSVGVSNFLIPHLEKLIDQSGVVPSVDQVELHPWYAQSELRGWCKGRDIAVTAWGPIFRGHIDEVPLVAELGEKYGKSPVQVTLRWHIQKGNIVIPKSVHADRIRQNAELFDFSLSADDMARMDALDCGKHFGNDPATFAG